MMMEKILLFILVLGLSKFCSCDESQNKSIIHETGEEHLMCFDFHAIEENFANIFDGKLSIYSRDNVARLIIFIEEFYSAYHEYQWVLNTALKSSMVLMPGGPAIPLVVNITLELMMHPNTQRAIERSLFRTWKNIEPTGDEQYAVQRENRTVIVKEVEYVPLETTTKSPSNESAFDSLMGFLPFLSTPQQPQQQKQRKQNQSGQNDSQSNVII
ncbi:uncharacterized protein LOC141854129 [Brevipalpus obovatus]|uniref:uncharacterized protein LOC141854129 n=1 Tax=Brevipalpus obovatus TaxID=246614 RepID=UPI003D9F6DF4